MRPTRLLRLASTLGLAAACNPLATPASTATPVAAPTRLPPSATPPDPTPSPPSESPGVVQEFIDASYRVLAVVKNPFAPYSLIVATARSKDLCGDSVNPQRCMNDTSCGSLYTSPDCYFFVEPDFVYGASAETRFVAQWRDGPDQVSALRLDTLRFTDATHLEFSSAGGDANFTVTAVWQLDLETGQVALISRDTHTGTP